MKFKIPIAFRMSCRVLCVDILKDWNISSLKGRTPILTRSGAISYIQTKSFTNCIRRRNPSGPILVEQSRTSTTSAVFPEPKI